MDEQTKDVLRRMDSIERPRNTALDHALCDAANLILAQDAALRAVREAPVVVVDTRKGRLYFDSFADEDATRSGERYALVPVPNDSEVGRG